MDTSEEENELIVRCGNIPYRLRRFLSGPTPGNNGRDLRREEHRYLQIFSFQENMAKTDV